MHSHMPSSVFLLQTRNTFIHLLCFHFLSMYCSFYQRSSLLDVELRVFDRRGFLGLCLETMVGIDNVTCVYGIFGFVLKCPDDFLFCSALSSPPCSFLSELGRWHRALSSSTRHRFGGARLHVAGNLIQQGFGFNAWQHLTLNVLRSD